MKSFALKAPLPTEDDECQNLIRWAKWQKWRGKRLSDLLLLIPNGAYLGVDPKQRAITMAKLKRTGLRPGVFDYLLAIPRGSAHGLFLELKRRQLGVVSLEQSQFQMDMIDMGYATAIAKGWEQAVIEINQYLGVV